MITYSCDKCHSSVDEKALVRFFVRFKDDDDVSDDYYLEICSQCKSQEESRLVEFGARRRDFD
jgi:hypothetical protein